MSMQGCFTALSPLLNQKEHGQAPPCLRVLEEHLAYEGAVLSNGMCALRNTRKLGGCWREAIWLSKQAEFIEAFEQTVDVQFANCEDPLMAASIGFKHLPSNTESIVEIKGALKFLHSIAITSPKKSNSQELTAAEPETKSVMDADLDFHWSCTDSPLTVEVFTDDQAKPRMKLLKAWVLKVLPYLPLSLLPQQLDHELDDFLIVQDDQNIVQDDSKSYGMIETRTTLPSSGREPQHSSFLRQRTATRPFSPLLGDGREPLFLPPAENRNFLFHHTLVKAENLQALTGVFTQDSRDDGQREKPEGHDSPWETIVEVYNSLEDRGDLDIGKHALKIEISILESANEFLQEKINALQNKKASPTLTQCKPTSQHMLESSSISFIMTAYFIMTEIDFNVVNIIIRYLENLTCIQDLRHRRKPNLALGHIISFISESKYNFQFPAPLDHLQILYSNSSFYILHSTRHCNIQNVDDEQVEVEGGPAPTPWEAHFDTYIIEHQQQHDNDMDHFDNYVAQ
ncbi:hypothetical protein M5K25_028384 [Dendrobium thyrsiflorum]|uniref:Uncharacterized protein n=1 Tax=Dendrobium thyrsiflorum TaxID=117978 RepID=A0ABD0TTJ8_DENTH